MMFTTEHVMNATGMTERQVSYLIRTGTLGAIPRAYDPNMRDTLANWSPQGMAQALAFSMLDGMEPTHQFLGAQAVGAVKDLETLRGMYVVLADDTVAIVSDPGDIGSAQTRSVLSCDALLARMPVGVGA